MSPQLEELANALFRDQLVVNVNIYPDIKEAERLWAEKLGCVRPKYNVIAARPDQDLKKFGLVWTEESRKAFLTVGVVRFSPEARGCA